MKFSNFMKSLSTNLDTLKNSKLAKFSILKSMFKKPYLSQYLWIPTNEGSKFKLDCVQAKNCYIILMDVINFKLRLINFVYIFSDTWYYQKVLLVLK